MIKEAYVSYEVAKLIKEKGFNNPCQAIWYDDRIVLLAHLIDNNSLLLTDEYKFSIQKESVITIPTHQMACAWLREKGIEIDAYLSHITEEFCKKTKHYVFSIVDLNTDKDYPEYSEDYHYYPTYEEAVEAALKYTLENLI